MNIVAKTFNRISTFIQPFVQTQIEENIKAPRHWPFCAEFTGTGEFLAQMASNAVNVSVWWRHRDFTDLHVVLYKYSNDSDNGFIYSLNDDNINND